MKRLVKIRGLDLRIVDSKRLYPGFGDDMKVFVYFVLFIVTFSVPLIAQSTPVQLNFEVDGKRKKQKFSVTFSAHGSNFNAKKTEKGFLVPIEILQFESFAVIFSSKKYHLEFNPVFRKDLDAVWTLGVDNPPFERDNTSSESYDGVSKLKYLRIRPLAAGTSSFLVVRE
jgi:hypothetical protein